MKFKDLTGQRFGRLVVIKRDGYAKDGKMIMWQCRCDCGNIVRVYGRNLTTGNSCSCGCMALEMHSTHCGSGDRLYKVWEDMKRRCYNQHDKRYNNYGGKGINVCDEWLHDYSAFRDWAYQAGYKPDAKIRECTLDRIDNDSDYSPNNCRWISNKQQQNNTSKTRFVIYNGVRYSLPELATIAGIKRQTLYHRLYVAHWGVDKAVSTPVKNVRKKEEYNGTSTKGK